MKSSIFQTIFTALCFGAVAGLLSLVLTRLLLWLLPKWGLLDKPDFQRHIHTRVVPRGGGLGMMVAFMTVAVLYCQWGGGTDETLSALKILSPLGILLPLGILDDRFTLRARTKFFFQVVAAAVAWYGGVRITNLFGVSLSLWCSCLLTLFWIVAMINAFNMIDGVDGLASGVGIISSLCMFVIALSEKDNTIAVLLIIFACSLSGFLRFNWHPAKLFMGDTGSMFIGYILAVIGLVLNARMASVASIGIPLLACGIPVLDICLAVWRRLVGTPPVSAVSLDADLPEQQEYPKMQDSFLKRCAHILGRLGTADQKHLHHRLLRYFDNNQQKTVWNIYGVAVAMGVMGIICCYLPHKNVLLALLIIIGTFSFIINRLAVIELWNSTDLLYHNFQSAKVGMVIAYVINPLTDLMVIVLSYVCLSGLSLPLGDLFRYVFILMLVLICSRSYRVFWNYAVSDDYFRLGMTLFAGFVLARFSDMVVSSRHMRHLHLYVAATTIAIVVLQRLGIHFIRNAQTGRQLRRFFSEAATDVTVLLGVGPMARLYRNRLLTDFKRAEEEQLLGIVACDPHFEHSYCYGMKVLGMVDDLKTLIQKYHINKIVICKKLYSEEIDRVRAIARDCKIKLCSLDVEETEVN